jgi:outer membrane protein assembly factor BamB
MRYAKIITYIVVIIVLLFSCEIFRGNDQKEKEVPGGEVVWRLDNEDELTVSTQPAIDDGNVYFIQDAKLKSYTLAKGNPRWSQQICNEGRTCDYSRTIVQTKDRLFIDQGFTIQAHDKSNGRIIWETWITENSEEVSGIGSPVMSQDESYLYTGRDGYALKVRKSDGEIIRRYPLDRLVPDGVTQGSNEPVISPFGEDILYVPTHYYDRTTPGEEEFGSNMFAFDAGTGDILWETRVEYKIDNFATEEPGDSVVVSPPIYDISVTDSSIVALQGKSIVVLNRFNGEMRWFTNFPESGFDVGLAVKDGGIYAASVGNFAHKVDLQTGEELWRRNIRYSNTSIPTVQNGRFYFNNSSGANIWVLDTDDGSVIYKEPPPNFFADNFDVYISSLGVGEGYMVNVGSKAVYCLTVP